MSTAADETPRTGDAMSVNRSRVSAGGMVNGVAVANEWLVVAAIAVDLVITFLNTVERYALHSSITWVEDAAVIALNIIAYLGAAAYIRRSDSMAFTALVDRLPPSIAPMARATGSWLLVLQCLLVLVIFPSYFGRAVDSQLPALGWSRGWVAVWLALGFALIVLFVVERQLRVGLRSALLSLGLAVLGMALLWALVWFDIPGQLGLGPLAPMLLVMLVSFALGTPIAFVLALGGFTFLYANGSNLIGGVVDYETSLSSFVLLAIPFFLIAGVLMEATGMARLLVRGLQTWVGHWPAGLLITQVVAMYIFSGISGSKAADVAAVGSVMKVPLRERGYSSTESVAVLAAAAAMGEAVPPSLALILLGSITSLSVGSLFLAGIVPTGVLAVVLMLGVLLRSRRVSLPEGPAFRFATAVGSVPTAVPALLVPLIVIGGIVGGIATPTEASSFAVVYGLLAAALFYRSLSMVTLWSLLRDGALMSGMVLLLVATASLLSQALVIGGLGQAVTTALTSIGGRTVFLLLSAIALVLLGFVLEGFPAILISAPLLLPIAVRLGVDPLQYGVILVMAIGIGVFAPLVGIGYYIACAVGEAKPESAIRPSLFYNMFLVAGLALVVALPQITLALPRALHR